MSSDNPHEQKKQHRGERKYEQSEKDLQKRSEIINSNEQRIKFYNQNK